MVFLQGNEARLARDGSAEAASSARRPARAFIVANPLTIIGVKALSAPPQTARSASPARRNIPPNAIACPPVAQAFAGATLGPNSPRCWATCPAAWLIRSPGTR